MGNTALADRPRGFAPLMRPLRVVSVLLFGLPAFSGDTFGARPSLDEPLADLSSLAVSAAVEIILSKLEDAAVMAVCGTRSPLLGRADRVVSLR